MFPAPCGQAIAMKRLVCCLLLVLWGCGGMASPAPSPEGAPTPLPTPIATPSPAPTPFDPAPLAQCIVDAVPEVQAVTIAVRPPRAIVGVVYNPALRGTLPGDLHQRIVEALAAVDPTLIPAITDDPQTLRSLDQLLANQQTGPFDEAFETLYTTLSSGL